MPVGGAKNSLLPILAATAAIPDRVTLCRCPALTDADVSCEILRVLGADTERRENILTVDGSRLTEDEVPDGLCRRMRSSVLFLGALLARFGEATVAYPGGCALGPRPVDLHLSALRRMGATVCEEGGRIRACAGHLRGAVITPEFPSVGATENILLAALGADGETVIHGAAREPEVVDLCRFLIACGADIDGVESADLRVRGGRPLHGCTYTVMPDRIEAATYLLAGAAAGGRVCVGGIPPALLGPLPDLLREAGCRVTATPDGVTVEADRRLRAVGPVYTRPYPGFPTDLQAPFVAAMATAEGTSTVVETLFSERYRYVGELLRCGADIRVCDRVAVVRGTERLSGAGMCCTDLRGGAATVLAGLVAEGNSYIGNTALIERGYEDMPGRLRRLGAKIEEVKET